jgi:hypothetical protein
MNEEEKVAKEALRVQKLKAEQAKLLAEEEARRKTYLAKEQEIEKGLRAREIQRAKDRAGDEIKDLAKEKARKEAYLAKEKTLADDHEARTSRGKSPDVK